MEEIENEEWKDVIGFDGLYQVSNLGRVKSFQTIKEKILKSEIIKGYCRVELRKKNKRKHAFVHVLVATAFIQNPNGYTDVNHKDENKENNCVDNLEWCDRKYNINFGTRNEKVSKKLSKAILQYDLFGNFIKEWESISECRKNGYNSGRLGEFCINNKIYKNSYWKYK